MDSFRLEVVLPRYIKSCKLVFPVSIVQKPITVPILTPSIASCLTSKTKVMWRYPVNRLKYANRPREQGYLPLVWSSETTISNAQAKRCNTSY
jgi:hypothetical protein